MINKLSLTPSLSLSGSSSLLSSLPRSPLFWLCCQGYRTASCCIYLDEAAACGSLSLLQDTNKRKDFHTSVSLSLTDTHTHPLHLQICVFLASHASSYSLCLSLSVCLLLTCKHTPSSPRQRSSKGIGVVLGVWLLVVWLTGSRAADGDVKTGSAR